jgi:hypothetical protein
MTDQKDIIMGKLNAELDEMTCDLTQQECQAVLAELITECQRRQVCLPDGIWTPWSQVLCYPCHGRTINNKFINDDDWIKLTTPYHYKGDVRVGKCMKCGIKIWIDPDVGMLQDVCEFINKHRADLKATLNQMGGMTAAIIVKYLPTTSDTDPYIMITINDDERYSIGGYVNELEEPVWWKDVSLREEVLEVLRQHPQPT